MAARDLLHKIITDAEPAGETRGPSAFTLPALRPYLPDRTFLRRIGTGLGVLATTAWRAARTGLRRALGEQAKKPTSKNELVDALELLGLAGLALVSACAAVAGALAGLGSRLLPYLPLATGIGAFGLLGAAYTVGQAAPEKPEVADVQPATPTAPEDLLARDRAAMLQLLDTATRGRNGIHLDPLHAITAAHPLFAGVGRPHLGALLDGLGIPTARTLSVDGIEGRTGVRRAVVEQLLTDAPAPPSQGSTNPPESGSDLRESRPLSDDSRAPLGVLSEG